MSSSSVSLRHLLIISHAHMMSRVFSILLQSMNEWSPLLQMSRRHITFKLVKKTKESAMLLQHKALQQVDYEKRIQQLCFPLQA